MELDTPGLHRRLPDPNPGVSKKSLTFCDYFSVGGWGNNLLLGQIVTPFPHAELINQGDVKRIVASCKYGWFYGAPMARRC